MPLTLAQLAPSDPRIKDVLGACGHNIRTTSKYYPQLLAGERRMWLDCTVCEKCVQVYAIDPTKERRCSSEDCPQPDIKLSRYNNDLEGRCNLCRQRDTDTWLALLQDNPGGDRDRIRGALIAGALTAVQIERRAGVTVADVYKHLTDLMAMGEVHKIDQSPGCPAKYVQAATAIAAAA